MIRGLYTAVTGLMTQEARQNVITQDLSNANTTGYKSDDVKVKDFKEVMLQNYQNIVNGKNQRSVIGSLSYGSAVDETTTDFSQGILKDTGLDTDFALNGKGFFVVSKDDGTGNLTNYYTRDGHFSVDLNGYLIDESGNKVMGRNSATGADEPIQVGNAKLTMDSSNNLYLDGKQAYKFDLVDFNNYNSMQKIGDNLYSAQNPINSDAVVNEKKLENSNVNVANAVTDMMTAYRIYESNQKVVQAMDETLGKAVNDVGTVR
ncbi:flagellar basal body rod protein FlgG [Clostridium sp. 19966]|uniref:flagellar hook-basal body complex protein n=1 Tax=Clostridium sp. 19966 TaxID=2768166 RepID=UPI0028DE4908|nr:flagellar hook-basal body complex protein [Clostridium sp. 19966]MDT8716636.1 flagellar basal body rod protein FlgG [Clostridium sp. 19966]